MDLNPKQRADFARIQKERQRALHPKKQGAKKVFLFLSSSLTLALFVFYSSKDFLKKLNLF